MGEDRGDNLNFNLNIFTFKNINIWLKWAFLFPAQKDFYTTYVIFRKIDKELLLKVSKKFIFIVFFVGKLKRNEFLRKRAWTFLSCEM